MILCLVTDRRRLGLAMGVGPLDWLDLLAEQVSAAVSAGVDVVQVREPDLEAAQLANLIRHLMKRVHGTSTRLLVNDRVDVAIAAKASGVHLKERSMLPQQVRRLVPSHFMISCSVHTIAGVTARKSADLLIAGTVMPTVSKPTVDYLNGTGLEEIVGAAAPQPVLGIGGMDIPSIPLLAASGAAGMAAVGAFVPGAGDDITEYVQNRVTGLRLAFDSASRRT